MKLHLLHKLFEVALLPLLGGRCGMRSFSLPRRGLWAIFFVSHFSLFVRASGPLFSCQLIAMDDPFQAPVMELSQWHVEIGFDEMSHDYHRYCYHIEHCDAEWQPTDGLFESNYLDGLNDQPIEDYEKSFNTTQIYTHYTLHLPNDDTRLLLSGNYRVTIYDEDDDERKPLAVKQFSLVEPLMSVSATVDTNTDIDFQQSHQQVSLAVGYGSLHVSDPERELRTYVMQNRLPDWRIGVQPNIRKAGGCEYTHQRALIFPATNEFHKFEQLDIRVANMNVDNIRWFDPYYHVTLYEEPVTRHYATETDTNGAYVLRNSDNEDNETTTEYAFFHFRLKSDPLPGGPVYVRGRWCDDWPSDDYKMQYDEQAGEYHLPLYLKLGYYNYQFVQLQEQPDGTTRAITDRTDGNFYQAGNEYQVFVYYRQPGSRYDRLVGYTAIQ